MSTFVLGIIHANKMEQLLKSDFAFRTIEFCAKNHIAIDFKNCELKIGFWPEETKEGIHFLISDSCFAYNCESFLEEIIYVNGVPQNIEKLSTDILCMQNLIKMFFNYKVVKKVSLFIFEGAVNKSDFEKDIQVRVDKLYSVLLQLYKENCDVPIVKFSVFR